MDPSKPVESVSVVHERPVESPRQTAALVRCDSHPEVLADWQCVGCEKAWCGDCVQLRQTSASIMLAQCQSCRDRCAPTAHLIRTRERLAGRAEEDLSLARILPDAFIRPITFWNVAMIAFLGFFLAMSLFLGPIYRILAYPFYLSVLRHVAKGKPGMPEFEDYSDWFDDILIPAIQFSFSYMVILIPVFVYFRMTDVSIFDAPGDPLFWILVLLGVAYLPGVLIIVAMSGSLIRALNPLVPLMLVTRLGWDYLVLLVACFGLFIAEFLVPVFLPSPWRYAAPWTGVYFWMVAMSLCGNVLRRNRDSLGVEF